MSKKPAFIEIEKSEPTPVEKEIKRLTRLKNKTFREIQADRRAGDYSSYNHQVNIAEFNRISSKLEQLKEGIE